MTTQCDPQTGACLLPDAETQGTGPAGDRQVQVIYVGDPMCSWCWGMSPEVDALAAHCVDQGLGFRMVMGGLRAGGGDAWNEAFRGFLRQEWTHIAAQTGQPFGFGLLELPAFSYDTEPACRAVVTAREMLAPGQDARRELAFFAAVQRKFYVEGEDPKEAAFYRDICTANGIDPAEFERRFSSADIAAATQADFRAARNMGVRGFPSVMLQNAAGLQELSVGYASFATLTARMEKIGLRTSGGQTA
ncbi:MAG: DsbA family protein [Rhodobacteraceae bacterium]|nr:DsbA family protein [Paracoccaceae bacterium]